MIIYIATRNSKDVSADKGVAKITAPNDDASRAELADVSIKHKSAGVAAPSLPHEEPSIGSPDPVPSPAPAETNVIAEARTNSIRSTTAGAGRPVSPPRESLPVVSAVTSRFAKDDGEGWRTVNGDDSGNATEHIKVDTNGRDFWLHARDIGNGKYFGWLAPAKFNGNQADKLGRFLRYRIRTNGKGPALSDTAVYVRLRGRGREIFVDQATVGRLVSNQWRTYSIKLDTSGGWKMRTDSGQTVVALNQDIEFVLANLKELWIRGEYSSGIDTCLLDDVEFGAESPGATLAPVRTPVRERDRPVPPVVQRPGHLGLDGLGRAWSAEP